MWKVPKRSCWKAPRACWRPSGRSSWSRFTTPRLGEPASICSRQRAIRASASPPTEASCRSTATCPTAIGWPVRAAEARMRRVLMLSPHFPPDSTAATHRVRLLAPHLSEYGWEPIVVTAEPAGYEGRLDADLAALVPAGLRVVRYPA